MSRAERIANMTDAEYIKFLEKENISMKKAIETYKDKVSQIYELISSKLDVVGNDNISLDDYLLRQKRIFQNKVNHGFNTTNIYQEARYILEEVTELMRAIEKNDRENMIEELADIIIFTYGCAEVARLGNLDEKIFEKMAINENRVYTKTEEGDFVKTGMNN